MYIKFVSNLIIFTVVFYFKNLKKSQVMCRTVRFGFDWLWPHMLMPPKPSDPRYALLTSQFIMY